MQQPKITVTLGSNRPGGIDIALAGLAAQTFQDFEVVFVDGRYYDRHSQVLEAVRQSGLKQPFFHVPNHRYADDIWGTTCAGYNTGFMLASGEIVVMLLDYAYAPPNWLEEHARHQSVPKIIMAPHEYRTLNGALPRDNGPVTMFTEELVRRLTTNDAIAAILGQRSRFDEISVFAHPFDPGMLDSFPVEESDAKCQMATGPFPDYNYFNTKNESFPLKSVLAINGMDENYDRGRGPGDPDLGLRLSRTGLPTWVVREAIVHCLNPRKLFPNLNIVIPENSRLPAPYEDRWYIQDGYNYFAPIKNQDSRQYAPNDFHIRKLREEIWSWRQLSQEKDPIIPKNVRPLPPTKKLFAMPRHSYDPKTQLNYIVWHNDPSLEAFVRHLIETVKPDRWVETGSHMGWTSVWIAQNYPDLPVYTVEVDEQFYRASQENLEPWPQISVHKAHSPDFLTKLLPVLQKGVTIFWLDAHWWPPVPLRDECKIVGSLDRYICLLDDFSCWQPDFSGDTFFSIAPSAGDAYLNDISYVCSELGEKYWRPNWEPKPGFKGVGMFLKEVDYQPPAELMRPETLDEFIALRAKSEAERTGQPDFFIYPLHPSSGRVIP